jgi:tRNA G18 (ribose-2'-O)-methylase SpoU
MWQADLTRPLALVIGGEADGPGPQARQLADTLINIRMPGNFESLNAGVAASLLLYEIIRQRNS